MLALLTVLKKMGEKWHRDGFQGSGEAWTWTRSAWEVAVGTGASSRWPSEVLWDPRWDALLEVLFPWFWVPGCLQPLAWSCFSLLCSPWWRHWPPVGPFLGFIEQLRLVAWGHLSFPTSQWLCRKILCVCVYFNCSHITSCCSSQCNRAFKKRLSCVPMLSHELQRNLFFFPQSENISMSSCPWRTVHFDRKWAKVGYGE